MSIIREKIQYTGNDINLKLTLSNGLDQTGHQQEIDEFTQIQTNKSINEPSDGEIRRFKFREDNKISRTTVIFSFYNQNTTQYDYSFINAGFTEDDVNNQNLNYLNSFFRLDFYDNFIPNQQTRIFSSYITKLIDNNFQDDPKLASYSIIDSNEFYYLNVPINFYQNNTNNIIDGYGLFTFYNAKSGKISLFYNLDNENLTTPEKMYFKIRLDTQHKSWDIITNSIENPDPNIGPRVYAKELIVSSDYIERYNNTNDNLNNLSQNYPSGSTFNYLTGKYNNLNVGQ
ncbi:MAG: hypothetical protein ACOC33_04205 [bacterium]